MNHRCAILIDGGFFSRKLYNKLGNKTPSVEDVVEEISKIRSHETLVDYELLRTYYYDAYPATGSLTNPINGKKLNLAETHVFKKNKAFLQKLELEPDISLRQGELSPRGYRLKKSAQDELQDANRLLTEADFTPDIEQKGVDLRIGLDIARLSLTRIVQTIVVVTGDSDFVPAFKFARREGVRVLLAHMEHSVKTELKAHTDGYIST